MFLPLGLLSLNGWPILKAMSSTIHCGSGCGNNVGNGDEYKICCMNFLTGISVLFLQKEVDRESKVGL